MNKLILLRHGQSQWNLENRFTGWKDVPLSKNGEMIIITAPDGETIIDQITFGYQRSIFSLAFRSALSCCAK